MLSVTRSPLASPALRTMASASTFVTTPSSPLSRSSHPHTHLPASMRTPRESYPAASYFSLVGTSDAPCHFSPACGSPAATPTPASISSILLSHGTTNNNAGKHLGIGRLTMNSASWSQATSDGNTSTANSVDAQARRKPTFKLVLPRRPTPARDDSFGSIALGGSMYSPGTPRGLTWSDSFDSVMTLKPIKGRVPTPYPKMDDSEWIQDEDEAIAAL